MKLSPWTCLIVGSLGLSPASTEAGYTFNFLITGSGINASGTLTANTNNNGSYTVVGGSGVLSGSALTASEQGALTLVANPAGTGYSYYQNTGLNFDDQVKPSAAQFLDYYGLMFTLANGTAVNIFGLGVGKYTFVEAIGSNYEVDTSVVFSMPTAVPEPSSLFLVALAIPTCLGSWWRKRSSTVAAPPDPGADRLAS